MAEVSFFNPEKESEIKRRREYANKLFEQAQAPKGTEMVSGIAVKQSPLEGIARMLQSGFAGYERGQADKDEKEYSAQKSAKLQEALQQYTTNPESAAAALAQIPGYEKGAFDLMSAQAKAQSDMAKEQRGYANQEHIANIRSGGGTPTFEDGSPINQPVVGANKYAEALSGIPPLPGAQLNNLPPTPQDNGNIGQPALAAQLSGQPPAMPPPMNPQQLPQQDPRAIYMKGKPVTEGLGEGQQWAAGPDGKRVAVDIPGFVSEEKRALQQALPGAIASSENSLNQIDQLIGSADGKTSQHPGLETSVGAKGLTGGLAFGQTIPGTDAADFNALLDQIKSGTFLEGFKALKGAGAITNIEGVKAENAIARLQTAQSEKEFIKAAKEYRDTIRKALDRQKGVLGAPPDDGVVDASEYFK